MKDNMVEECKTIIEKVKDWLYDNFRDYTRSSDYGDYTTLEADFETFEEMMDDFNKKIEE